MGWRVSGGTRIVTLADLDRKLAGWEATGDIHKVSGRLVVGWLLAAWFRGTEAYGKWRVKC